jgi:hypothetical protein
VLPHTIILYDEQILDSEIEARKTLKEDSDADSGDDEPIEPSEEEKEHKNARDNI